MLKVQSNSRQIPSVEQYTANKQFNDLLYGILQEMSYMEKGIRYIDKRMINFTALAKSIGLTRQTLSSRFKSLVSLGLVEYIETQNRYKLNYLDKTLCSLVPFRTLQLINATLSHHAISIYVYLLNRFLSNNEEPYIVAMSQMKQFIGVATSTTSNNYIINDILIVLERIGLIRYELKNTEQNKTNIIIVCVRNTVRETKKSK